jgi:bifunctional DNA-binding transcriptional regulator/antitoxin component of YhaV-PrlF toxin-antitoxin module
MNSPDRLQLNQLIVDAKGRVTLPEHMLAHMGVNVGERLQLIKRPDGSIQLKAAPPSAFSKLISLIRSLFSLVRG